MEGLNPKVITKNLLEFKESNLLFTDTTEQREVDDETQEQIGQVKQKIFEQH